MVPIYESRSMLEAICASEIESCFHNYINYCLFNRWYTRFPSLVHYIRELVSSKDVTKFLFFMNPLLDQLIGSGGGAYIESLRKKILDEAIVETCCKCVRGFEHIHPLLLEEISKDLESQGLNTLDSLTMLAKT